MGLQGTVPRHKETGIVITATDVKNSKPHIDWQDPANKEGPQDLFSPRMLKRLMKLQHWKYNKVETNEETTHLLGCPYRELIFATPIAIII